MDAVFAVVWKEYLKKRLTFLAEKDNIIPTMKGSNRRRLRYDIVSAMGNHPVRNEIVRLLSHCFLQCVKVSFLIMGEFSRKKGMRYEGILSDDVAGSQDRNKWQRGSID